MRSVKTSPFKVAFRIHSHNHQISGCACIISTYACASLRRCVVARVVVGFLITTLTLPANAYAITVFLTSGASWTVPSDWSNSDNSIECIGSGGSGGGPGGVSPSAGTSGGGGGGSSGSGSASSNAGAAGGCDTTFDTSYGACGGGGGSGGSDFISGVSGAGGDGSIYGGGGGGSGASFFGAPGAGGAGGDGLIVITYTPATGGGGRKIRLYRKLRIYEGNLRIY